MPARFAKSVSGSRLASFSLQMNQTDEPMEATTESAEFEHATGVTVEAVELVTESTIHRTADAFAESVDSHVTFITGRREIPETSVFEHERAEAVGVAETGFRNGRTAALRARPGEDPDPNASIETAAFDAEANARQYSGHVPGVIYGRADREILWHCYEKGVSAGIRSVRRTPFGSDGPIVYDTASRSFDVRELLAERLRIESRTDGRRAYDVALPMSFVEELRPMAGDVRVASQFVWSYSGGTCGPLPYTEKGVSLLRAYNEKRGTRYEAPERVVRFVEA